MATTALGIAQSSEGQGVTPLTHRRIIGSKWQNIGIVEGLEVSGRTDLSYDVGAGCAVCSRADSDGMTEAYWEGGTAGPVSAGDPANPRIDVVWIKANDLQQADPDNLVHVGVTEGTPAAAPVAPEVPAGCTPLVENVMPANATSTSAATVNADGYRAIPYGASLGLILNKVDTSNGNVNSPYVPCTGQITVPTDRYVSLKVTITMGVNGGSWADGDGSVYSKLLLDGSQVDYREIRLRKTGSAVSNYYEYVLEVPKGTHTVTLQYNLGIGTSWYRYYGGGWAGQRLQVLDIGPVS